MRSIVAVLLVLAYCEARPNPDVAAVVAMSPESYIIGGTDAEPGEFPWQLSQQRLGATWSHSCGASLLKASYALTAAHCVNGASTSVVRVLAGLHDQSQPENAIVSNCLSYKVHESYNSGPGTFPNDIAIITLATPIADNGGNIQYAQLPIEDDHFIGRTVVISGWGRTSASNVLPTILQKATIGVISTEECNQRLSDVNGASVTDEMICLFNEVTSVGSCNGDSGGPANIKYPDESTDSWIVVAGVTSWGIQGSGECLPSYPSVYTRTSDYLDWISTNTP